MKCNRYMLMQKLLLVTRNAKEGEDLPLQKKKVRPHYFIITSRNAKEGEEPTILLLREIRFRKTKIFSFFFFFFFLVLTYVSILDDNYLSSDKCINQFLRQTRIEPQISYITIKDFTFFLENFNLWRSLLMITLYHLTKTLINFWYRRE